ncbi:glycosyltransferase family 1 protein [bacterium]|nr:MAG: glycosyltransferase family 1 protein [bacterium]
MAKIKVLRIIARLNIGGPAIHTTLLTAGLDKNRFSSLLVCGAISKGEGDMGYYAAQKGVRPIFIPQLRRELNPFNDLMALAKIFKIVLREKPDIIHTHTAKAGTLGRIAGIIYNLSMRLLCPAFGWARNDRWNSTIKLIHTFHGHVFDGYFNSFANKIFVIIEKILASFTDKIITVSGNVKSELISLGIAEKGKIEVIPLGFELDNFLEIRPKVTTETLSIGIVGRLVPVKNHYLFLESANLLRLSLVSEAEPFKLRFIIVGDGELRRELEECAHALNLSEYVEFAGWQKGLPQVYADLDIVCLTSLNEGTPVSLIEAMASSKAIVATDVGGVRDLLGEELESFRALQNGFNVRHRGVTVKSNDVNAFARALKLVLEDKELRKNLSISGREYVKNKFTRERLVADTEELYLKTLKI